MPSSEADSALLRDLNLADGLRAGAAIVSDFAVDDFRNGKDASSQYLRRICEKIKKKACEIEDAARARYEGELPDAE